jgi:hypothetical protein
MPAPGGSVSKYSIVMEREENCPEQECCCGPWGRYGNFGLTAPRPQSRRAGSFAVEVEYTRRITMTSILLSVLWGVVSHLSFGKHSLDAAEALDKAPITPTVQRYRAIAFIFFMTAAVLLLTAAILDSIANERFASECFGWSGIGCLHACVITGLIYKAVNHDRPA